MTSRLRFVFVCDLVDDVVTTDWLGDATASACLHRTVSHNVRDVVTEAAMAELDR